MNSNDSWHRVSSPAIQPIPFFARESHTGACNGLAHAFRSGRTKNDLHPRGMAGNPSNGHTRRRDAVDLGDLIKRIVEFRIGSTIADKGTVKELLLKRRPRLKSH